MLAFITEATGFGEWCVLLAVALVAAGPKRLPALAREAGRLYARFRRAAEGIRRELFELDAEISRGGDKAVREIEGAFAINGNEATAKPFLEA